MFLPEFYDDNVDLTYIPLPRKCCLNEMENWKKDSIKFIFGKALHQPATIKWLHLCISQPRQKKKSEMPGLTIA